MSVNYPVDLINARLADVASAIDAGGSAGFCQLFDGGGTLISALALNFPCGSVASGMLIFSTPWIDSAAAATGTPVSARIQDSTGANVVTGLTVGTGSTSYDIVLSGSITAGQTVAITAATITGR